MKASRVSVMGKKVKAPKKKSSKEEFLEPDDTVYHEVATSVQDYSAVSVEAPKEQLAPSAEDITRQIEARIGSRIEQTLQNYLDRYFYAEMDKRFRELMACVVKEEPGGGVEADLLNDIRKRLTEIEQTQQKLLQYQMEMDLELVCNKCGKTLPEDSEVCTFCTEQEEDFVVDERDYETRKSGDELGNHGIEDLSEALNTSQPPRDDYYNRPRRGFNEDDDYLRRDYDRGDDYYGRRPSISDNYDPTPSKKGSARAPAQGDGPPPPCPKCFRPLKFITQYDAYYCSSCSGYLDNSTGKIVGVEGRGEKKKGSKRFSDADQKLEDVVSYIEYDPDREPVKAMDKEKKKKGLFGFGKKG
jgi:hypothetical protein